MRARVEKRSVLGWNKSSTSLEILNHIIYYLKINGSEDFNVKYRKILFVDQQVGQEGIGIGWAVSSARQMDGGQTIEVEADA